MNAARKSARVSINIDMLSILPRYFLEFGIILALVFMASMHYMEVDTTEIFKLLVVFAVVALRVMPSTSAILSSIVRIRSHNSISRVYESVIKVDRQSLVTKKDLCQKRLFWGQKFQLEFKNISFSYSEKSGVTITSTLVFHSGDSWSWAFRHR